MAASYIGFTNAPYSAATSFDAQVPANVATGDLLICVLFKNTAGTTPTIPAGWAVATVDNAARLGAATSTLLSFAGSPAGGCAVYWKLAEAADEAAPTYTWTVDSSNGSMTMLAFRDVQPQLLGGAFHTAMLFEQVKIPSRSSTTIAAPALGSHNCAGDKTIVIAAIGQLATGSFTMLSSATGYTEVANNSNTGISSSIGYSLVDLLSDPDVGVKQVTTDTASGNGAGWVLLIGDSSGEDINYTPVQPVVGATRSELVNAMNSNLTVEQGAVAKLPLYVTLDDHVTPATGLASGDFTTKQLTKPGGTMQNVAFVVTEQGSGWYEVELSNTNTDTIGLSIVYLLAEGCDPAHASFQVETARAKEAQLPAALVGGRVDASVGAMQANVVTAAAVATDAIDADSLAADARAAIAAAVMSYAHEAGRTVLGVLRRLDALMTGKATGLIGATVAFFRPDGTTKAIEATQDVVAGTRDTASTVGGD
jgi:hypothetical protein